MQTEKVHLTQVKETALGALYFRAMDSRSKAPFLGDSMAEEAIKRIDYDFEGIKAGYFGALQVVVRAKQLDVWTADFLTQHPEATVLSLGCGLDSRVYRIDPPPGVHWFDVDYSEVIELHRKLYPERTGYHRIGSSVTEAGWLDEVPGDQTAWILAEGLTYFVPANDMKTLLNRLTGHFPNGEMVFDAVSRLGAKMAQRVFTPMDITVGFWIDNARDDIKLLDPKLELVTELQPRDQYGVDRLPVAVRALGHVMALFPSLCRINRILRYRF